jgi:uncharacterized membrane protein
MTQHNSQARTAEQLAVGLGWFSIGLGLAEVVAPRSVAQLIGLPETDRHSATLQALGVREIAHGVAILAQPGSATRVWTRVGGDALDVAVLGAAMTDERTDRGRLMAAIGAVLGVSALDVYCAQQLGRTGRPQARRARGRSDNAVRIERVTTINRSAHDLYQFWRNFENLPRFMRHLESVETLDNGRSRWRAKGPAGMHVEWEAELLQDREGEWIAWRSIEGADVQNSGSVRFQPAPGGRGTEVRIQLQYSPPGGALGRTFAWLFGEEPDQQIHEDLHRFKQLMETGEIPLSDGPSLWRAARPPQDPAELKALVGVQS